MGLFFPSDPIVHGQRAKGLPRYQELLERDWKSFLFADFVTLGLCIPYGLGVGYALLSSSLLVLLPVCILGGLLVGPAISGMMDALFRSYRDAPAAGGRITAKPCARTGKPPSCPASYSALRWASSCSSAWCCSLRNSCRASGHWPFSLSDCCCC